MRGKLNQHQENIVLILKEDLKELHDRQRNSSEIEYVRFDFMQLHKIIEIIDQLSGKEGEK